MTEFCWTPKVAVLYPLNTDWHGAGAPSESFEVDMPFDEDGDQGVGFSCFPGYVAYMDMPEDLQIRRLLEKAARLIAQNASDQLSLVIDQLDAFGVDLVNLSWLRLPSMETAESEGDWIFTSELAARRQRFHSMFCLVRCGLMRGHEHSIVLINHWEEWADSAPPGSPQQRIGEESVARATAIKNYRDAVFALNHWIGALSLAPHRQKQLRENAEAYMSAHEREAIGEGMGAFRDPDLSASIRSASSRQSRL